MQCSHCGASNPDNFKFCGTCGTPLAAPTPLPMGAPSSVPRSDSSLRIGALVIPAVVTVPIAIFGICLCLLVYGLSPGASSRGTVQSIYTPAETGLTYASIVQTARSLTEIKRNNYYQSLIGETVHWSGTVADVSKTGDIHVRITNTLSYDVVVQGISKATATTLNLKDAIQFDGAITDVSDPFGSGTPIITVKATSLNKQ